MRWIGQRGQHGAFGVGEHDRAEGRLRAALPSAVLLALFREVCRVPHRSPYQPDAVDPQVYDLLTATCNGPTIDDRRCGQAARQWWTLAAWPVSGADATTHATTIPIGLDR